MQSLAKVQAGESCEIKWMFGNADVMNFLERYGIKEGSRIRVLGRVLDGLIFCTVCGTALTGEADEPPKPEQETNPEPEGNTSPN